MFILHSQFLAITIFSIELIIVIFTINLIMPNILLINLLVKSSQTLTFSFGEFKRCLQFQNFFLTHPQ